MSLLFQSFCVYVVVSMGLAVALIISAYLYWIALEKIITIVGIKKELIKFIWDRRKNKRPFKPTIKIR